MKEDKADLDNKAFHFQVSATADVTNLGASIFTLDIGSFDEEVSENNFKVLMHGVTARI